LELLAKRSDAFAPLVTGKPVGSSPLCSEARRCILGRACTACAWGKRAKLFVRGDVEKNEEKLAARALLCFLNSDAEFSGDLVVGLAFAGICRTHGGVKLCFDEDEHAVTLDACIHFSHFIAPAAVVFADKYFAVGEACGSGSSIECELPQF